MARDPGALTRRSVALGAGLGAIAALSNLYVSLKTAWTLPVMTSAVLVAFGAGAFCRGAGDARARPAISRAEALGVAALASSAGYMAGGGNAAAIPALGMLGMREPATPVLVLWCSVVAALGVALAPLLARTVRDATAFPFPTAAATAELVKHLSRASETMPSPASKGRALFVLGWSSVGSAAFAAVRAALGVPATIGAPGRLFGIPLAPLSVGVDTSLVLAAAGAIMNLRTALSTLLGAVGTYFVVAPVLLQSGAIASVSYRSIVEVMVWPAAAMLVASSMASLAFELPRLLAKGASPSRAASGEPPAADTRRWLVLAGLLAVAAIALEVLAFGVALRVAILAIPAAALVALVAARAMGETDAVPTKALAPIAQLGAGAASGDLRADVVVPNVTSSVALHAADALSVVRAARLLGVAPRAPLVAQLVGCLVGALVVMPAYRLLVPDAGSTLPSADLPAPGVLVWKSVAEAVARGLDALPAAARFGAGLGAASGVVLAGLERAMPPRLARFVPSPAGLGSGMVLPASNALAIAMGALVRAAGERHRPSVAALVLPVSSGLIAGESVVGVAVQILTTLGAFVR